MSPSAQRIIPLTSSTSQPAGEPLARPKVMRRPASFTRPSPAVATPSPAAMAPAPPLTADLRVSAPEQPLAAAPATQLTNRPWQEDARFGLVLALILLVLNAALFWSLPKLRSATPSASAPQEQATSPAPVASPVVTVYTHPAAPAPYTPEGVDDAARDAGLAVQPYHILGSATDSGPNQ